MALDADGKRITVGDVVEQIGTGQLLTVRRVPAGDQRGAIVHCEKDGAWVGQTGRQIRVHTGSTG